MNISIPVSVGKGHKRKHYRNFYQNSHNGYKCSRRLKAKQCNGYRHSQFEKVAGANHGCRCTYSMTEFKFLSAKPGQEKDEVGLNYQGHSSQKNDQGIIQDILTLESKQQHKSYKESNYAYRL
jgi:hypothetical protein